MSKNIQQLMEILTPQEMEVAELLVENSYAKARGEKKLTINEIAEQVGVHRNTVRNWRKKPEFLQYQQYLSMQESASMLPDLLAQLHHAAHGDNNAAKSVKSAELLMKYHSLLVDRSEMTYINDTPQLSQEEIDQTVKDLASRVNAINNR